MAISPVILMTNELATSSAVAEALANNGRLAKEDVCRNLVELAARLERGAVPAALVDIDGAQPDATLSGLDPIVRRFADTRFIVLSNVMQPELLLEAMQVGARHYLLKPAIASDLEAVLGRVCPERAVGFFGEAVTILSAGGGCGATTVAVNLANELALAGHEQTLVADLDPCYGGVGSYLGLDGEYGILDLLARAGTIDGHLVETTAVRSSEWLSALLSTSAGRLGEPMQLEPERLAETVAACKQHYRHVVFDAPRLPLSAAAQLARDSVRTFVVLQLTVKDIRVARRLINGLTERGVENTSITPLVSRYRKRSSLITLIEARRALADLPVETIGNDFAATTEAVNLGKPLSHAAPRSEPRHDLQRLAVTLAGIKSRTSSNLTGR